MKLTGRSEISSTRWVKRHWGEYKDVILRRCSDELKDKFPSIRVTKPKYAYKELIAQGFVPLSQFKMRLKSKKYAYIITNKLLSGEILIYPEHFVHGYSPRYKNIYEAHEGIGLDGYTRVYLTCYKYGIAK